MILNFRGSRDRVALEVLFIVIQFALVYSNRPLLTAQDLDASAVSGAEPDRNGVRRRPPDPSRGSSTERGRHCGQFRLTALQVMPAAALAEPVRSKPIHAC